MTATLDIKNLGKTYQGGTGNVRALEEVTLSLNPGDFVAVQGPSGCGKSTLLLSAGGLLAPDAGEIEIDGQNPYQLSHNDRARFRAEKLGYVFQQFHLVPFLNVLDNILAPSLALPDNDAPQRAEELLEHFNLAHRTRHVPAELSTGERQRTALARALLNRPKLILADEPTGNLDNENATVVLTYLKEFTENENGTVLLVTHDDKAAEYAGRVIRLKEGKMVHE